MLGRTLKSPTGGTETTTTNCSANIFTMVGFAKCVFSLAVCKFVKNSEKLFFLDEVIRPCKVQLNLLKSADEIKQQNFISCVYCGLQCKGSIGLHTHVVLTHQAVSKSRCDVCFTYFSNEIDRYKHQEEKHFDVLLYKCIYCNEVFRNRPRLHLHVRQLHKNEVIVRCKRRRFCCMYFHSEEEKAEHERTMHCRKNPKCFYCDAVFKCLTSIVNHVRKHHADKMIRCKYEERCRKYFHSEEEMAKHIKKVHEGANMKKCPFCPLMFAQLETHIRICHNDKVLFTCNFQSCKKPFFSEKTLRNHEMKTHKNKGPKWQTRCIFCGKNVLKTSINWHLQWTHKSQLASAFKCTLKSNCSQLFLTKAELDEHVKSTHLKLQLVKCIYCNIEFKQKCLYTHVFNHHRDLRIKCPIKGCIVFFLNQLECDQHFSQQHQEDENSKQFKCEKCNFSAAKSFILKIHIENLHGINSKVKCQRCPKLFRSNNYLRTHVKRVHPE